LGGEAMTEANVAMLATGVAGDAIDEPARQQPRQTAQRHAMQPG
jgi:hypothetical protein